MNAKLLEQILREDPAADLPRINEALEIIDVELRSDFYWYTWLSEPRKAALLRFALAMGPKVFLEYRACLGSVRDGKLEDAACCFLSSDWAKSHPEARFIARQLACGEWQ